MHSLCDDLIRSIIICIYEFEYLYNIILINKFFLSNFKSNYEKMLLMFNIHISNTYPTFIRNIFDNISKMRDIPELEFKEQYMGETGSIDKISNEVINAPIMYCVNNRTNCFIILKLNIKIYRDGEMENDEYNYNSNYINVINSIVIYQKPNIYYRWCIGSKYPYYGIVFNNIINYNDIITIKRLINGETVKSNNCEIWI